MRTNFSGNNEEATASFSKEEATASLSPIKIGANSSTASDITKKEESEKNRIMAIQKDAAVQASARLCSSPIKNDKETKARAENLGVIDKKV